MAADPGSHQSWLSGSVQSAGTPQPNPMPSCVNSARTMRPTSIGPRRPAADGRIAENQPVYVDYRHALLRFDSIVLTRDGQIELREGRPRRPRRCRRNWQGRAAAGKPLGARYRKLESQHLFPILESAYPEPPKASPSPAERQRHQDREKTWRWQPFANSGLGRQRYGMWLPAGGGIFRWQAQFVARLPGFPKANIELIFRGLGRPQTDSYLGEPPGSDTTIRKKCGPEADLIVSEFVNDAGLTPEQVEQRYGKLPGGFHGHRGPMDHSDTPLRSARLDGASQSDVDADPRAYVAGLRLFAARHRVALADASLRWGRFGGRGFPTTRYLQRHQPPRRPTAKSCRQLWHCSVRCSHSSPPGQEESYSDAAYDLSLHCRHSVYYYPMQTVTFE